MLRKLMLKVKVCIAESEWHLGQTLFLYGPMSIKQMHGVLLIFDLNAGYVNRSSIATAFWVCFFLVSGVGWKMASRTQWRWEISSLLN
jgi:hypothetical protein